MWEKEKEAEDLAAVSDGIVEPRRGGLSRRRG
jgi:hypothetical protein